MKLEFMRTDDGVTPPQYAKQYDAGFDLRSTIDIVIEPKSYELVPTGLKINLPIGTEAQVRSRSGLALKNGIFVLNSPGTVDCGYLDEVKVILMNLGKEPFVVSKGDRIAQMVINEIKQVEFIEVEKFENAYNRNSGFGGTGIK